MRQYPHRLPGPVLTVVLRDDSPLIHCNDSPSFRSRRITLTDEQRNHLALECTGTAGGAPLYEVVSKCFIEPDDDVADGG